MTGHPEHSRALSITSIQDRLGYALYHIETAEEALTQYVATVPPSQRVRLLYPNTTEGLENSVRFRLIAGANVVAAVQSIHAIGDLLAHVIYLSLGGRYGGSLKERDVSLVGVYGWLSGAMPNGDAVSRKISLCADTRAGSLAKTILDDLITQTEFKRIATLCNLSKHKSMVRIGPSIGLAPLENDIETSGLIFESFSSEGVEYYQVNAISFLRQELERIWLIVDSIQKQCNTTSTIK